jgi:hypothetical protein
MPLVCIGLDISSAAGQSGSEGVPPWQLPPGSGASHSRRATVERMAFESESADYAAGEEPQPMPPSNARQSVSRQDAGFTPYEGSGDCGVGESCDVACDESVSCYSPLQDRLWLRGEYLMMWGKTANVPPLATTSNTGTARSNSGILGLSSTRILFGNENADFGSTPGARFTIGYWFDNCQESGLEATYLFLGNKSVNFEATSDTTPILAVPFFNIQTANQDALIFAYPGQQTATMNISLTNELHSLELLWRSAILQDCNRRLDFLIGYRYGRFSEDLSSDATSDYLTTVGLIPAGTRIRILDQFSTINDFHGAQVGIAKSGRYSNFSLELLGKLAIGSTRSTVTVNGATVVTPPGGTASTSSGGLLALPTNMGTFEQRNFSMIPELGINAGYNFTSRLKVTAGYTLLYWSRVARPSDQIDTNINPTQLPPGPLTGNPLPQAKFISSDYWVQGLTLGFDYRY